MKRSRIAALAAVVLLVATTAPAALARPGDGPSAEENAQTTEVQILALNDFHGNLEPPSGSGGRIGALTDIDPGSGTNLQCVEPDCVLAGGAEYLATHVRTLEATNPNTLFVSAGDMIGATPLVSALFHDEPTIEAFNLMGLDYNGVGNHEFDEGVDELLRMQNGGCHPVDGCLDGDPFAGAAFKYLAANVAYKDSGKTIFPPYAIHKFNGVKVGIVGMTLEGTPTIVTPAGISHVDFFDEADSVNALVPVLKRQGVEAIIVLLHEGGQTTKSNGVGTIAAINECNDLSGPLPPIVERMDDAIDVVITGHTNWAVNCVVDGKIVTGAAHQGRLVTDIDLVLSRATKDVVSAKVNNEIVTRSVAKAPDLTALITKYKDLSAPLANRVVGSITADITGTGNPAGESAAGDVIADAQFDATSAADRGAAVVAFMNPGGIRGGGFVYANSAAGEAPGAITYGELFTVQPFSNVLTVLSCTGSQIDAALEQQFDNPAVGQSRILQVSRGFTYAWSSSAPKGSKVDIAGIRINGVPVDPSASYRVTINNFLATGGDNFTVFPSCTQPLGGDVDIDALEAYFGANSPVAPGPQDRITLVP